IVSAARRIFSRRPFWPSARRRRKSRTLRKAIGRDKSSSQPHYPTTGERSRAAEGFPFRVPKFCFRAKLPPARGRARNKKWEGKPVPANLVQILRGSGRSPAANRGTARRASG